jgi:outer membrane protein
MKMRYLKLIALTLLLPTSLAAQVGSKVGVIDIGRVVRDCASGVRASEQIQIFFDERRGLLEALQNELNGLQERLQTQERALSQSALAELNRDIQTKTTQLTRNQEDAELELQAKQQELIAPVVDAAGAALEEYAREQGYTLILDASSPQSGIVFVEEVADITTEIIRRLDAAETGEPSEPGPKPQP